MKRWWALVAVACSLLGLGGCQSGTLPDPNEPGDSGLVPAAVLRRNLDYANKLLEHRQSVGEITEEQRNALLQKYAEELLSHVSIKKIPGRSAWEYGDVFKVAQRWPEAKEAYTIAVENAKTENRRVNDSLRLALAMAELGEVDQAIECARTVFDTTDTDAAPILPAVLFEIAPAATGRGRDGALAYLLEDAIAQHERTQVDPTSEAGKAFLIARPHHILRAYKVASRLYRSAGMDEDADRTWAEFKARGGMADPPAPRENR